jgi:uncharacterized membrane protein
MNTKRYKQTRILVAIFISTTVSLAVNLNSYILAAAGVITGMLFMILVRSKIKIRVDERERAVREKTAQMTYAIVTPILGLGSFLILMMGRGEFVFLQTLGTILSYVTLFMIAVYAIAFHFLNRKYGGSGDEE